MSYRKKYDLWLNSEVIDELTKKELVEIVEEKEIEDRFYKELEFGTGGLRGVIGAGSNRMNIYTVGKATQGFAMYLINTYSENKSVCIAYDSRNMSKEFAEAAALVLCANGVKVYLFESLRPTPMLSFTVSHLKCQGGIVITASHNPKQYNGYKVYGEYGGQVTDDCAKEILSNVEEINDFKMVKTMSEAEAKDKGLLVLIGEDVDKVYYEKVKDLTIRKDLVKEKAKDLNIIFTPIHGSGNIPVRRVLNELGYDNLVIVKEQELPDGNFPTASYPNPEEPKVFELALSMANEVKPDLIIGTDPDCDRIGLVIKDNKGEYKILSGNQTGILLAHYIMDALKETGKLPNNSIVIKTIVTSEMIRAIAPSYGVEVLDVLTGFKYIGEKIFQYEKSKEKSYLFGFEESFGYLAGTFVRDKDAVVAAMFAAEMALYYKTKGLSVYDALMELYSQYGYYKEDLVSIELVGREGQEKISNAIEYLRHSSLDSVDNVKIITKLDYKLSTESDLVKKIEKVIKLPKSNVLKFLLEDGSWFVVRPSGTEPKMKIYLSVKGSSLQDSEEKLEVFKEKIMEIVNMACNS